MFKSTDYLRRIIAPVGGQGGVPMSYLCPNCNSFPLEDYVRWFVGRNIQTGGPQFVEKYDWKQPNRLLVVQTGDIEQAKVFKAHAVPQGLCANSINCVEIAGESQRGWRRPPTEHRDEPRHGKQKRFSRTACVNPLRLTLNAPWMLESHAEAQERSRFGSRKFRKGDRR